MRPLRGFRAVLVAGALACAFALNGIAPAMAASFSVQAVEYHFAPKSLTIHVGDTVVWTNAGTVPHTVTADGGSFNSGNLNPGATFSHTFTSAGTFAYKCQYHFSLGMVGTITVLSSGGGGSGTPLPNTGLSASAMPIAIVGLGFILLGGVVLASARRRRRA